MVVLQALRMTKPSIKGNRYRHPREKGKDAEWKGVGSRLHRACAGRAKGLQRAGQMFAANVRKSCSVRCEAASKESLLRQWEVVCGLLFSDSEYKGTKKNGEMQISTSLLTSAMHHPKTLIGQALLHQTIVNYKKIFPNKIIKVSLSDITIWISMVYTQLHFVSNLH